MNEPCAVSVVLQADAFRCPITHAVFQDPVTAADGFSYEADAIRKWMGKSDVSPMTNLRFEHKELVPNRSLKSAIEALSDVGYDGRVIRDFENG